MAKKQKIEKNVETGIIVFTESGDSYDINELPQSIKNLGLLNGVVQRLSDLNAGFGPKAGYTAIERQVRREAQWQRFKKGHWTLKRKEREKGKSLREALKRALKEGMSFKLSHSVICPQTPEADARQIWDNLKAE
jgi:hypothetical protein